MAAIVGRIDPAVLEKRMKDHEDAKRVAQERKMWKKYAPDKYLKAKITDGKNRKSFNGIKVKA